MIYTRVDALLSLKPKAQFSWAGTEIYSELNYLSSDTPPTEAELDTEVTRLNNLEPMRLLRKERNKNLDINRKKGILTGGSDSRKDGCAIGY